MIIQKKYRRSQQLNQVQKKVYLMGAAIIKLSNNKTIETNCQDLIQEFKEIYEQDPMFSDYLPSQLMFIRKPNQQASQPVILSLRLRQVRELNLKDIKIDKDYDDQPLNEKGSAKMKCGHDYTRSDMRNMIENLVKAQHLTYHEVKCDHIKVQGQPCNESFTFEEWTLIGGFNKTEVNQLKNLMSQNYLKAITKKCPQCQQNIIKENNESPAVHCQNCHSESFCYNCLQKWQDNNVLCQSQICQTYRILIQEAPWTYTINLLDPKTKSQRKILTPTMRACPRCKTIIQNTNGGKHTKCPCMNNQDSFCYVCLGLYEDGKWPCGKYDEYCGLVAPVQTFK